MDRNATKRAAGNGKRTRRAAVARAGDPGSPQFEELVVEGMVKMMFTTMPFALANIALRHLDGVVLDRVAADPGGMHREIQAHDRRKEEALRAR